MCECACVPLLQNYSSLLCWCCLFALVDRIHYTNSITTKTTRLAYNALCE